MVLEKCTLEGRSVGYSRQLSRAGFKMVIVTALVKGPEERIFLANFPSFTFAAVTGNYGFSLSPLSLLKSNESITRIFRGSFFIYTRGSKHPHWQSLLTPPLLCSPSFLSFSATETVFPRSPTCRLSSLQQSQINLEILGVHA